MSELTPRSIVEELSKHIVGQDEAKRSVAVALRNRYRRSQLSEELQEEILPKNILMIGPTGVGKTEIARRLARLVRAPFVKVEATKFTEVGYVGRDVESMIRDLVEMAIRMVQSEALAEVHEEADRAARRRLLDIIAPVGGRQRQPQNPFEALFSESEEEEDEDEAEERDEILKQRKRRRQIARKLDAGELDEEEVEIEVQEQKQSMIEVFGGSGMEELGMNLESIFGNMLPSKKKKRRVPIREARALLRNEEAHKLIDDDQIQRQAVDRVENHGIIFLDELDKVVGEDSSRYGPDVSREGVQRDILPIVEGTTVMTKYGPVRTDHTLFIAAGAFHTSKPSNLIPELQGRIPIRVEMDSLSREDLRRILVEPKNSLTRQYIELLRADGVELQFTDAGLDAIARISEEINDATENIGARRLHTVMEKLLQDVSFEAPEEVSDCVVVDEAYVEEKLASIVEDRDLSHYIL